MRTPKDSTLLAEIETLRLRLAEAEETLRAIREGEVDAVVVSGTKGEQIFSLVSVDSIYRLIVETMREAAFTVTFDGKILFCNAQFGELVKRPLELIVGHPLQEFVEEGERASATSLLVAAQQKPARQRLVFQDLNRTRVPTFVSANVLNQPDNLSICVVASDLSELENSTELIQRLRRQQETLQAANEGLAVAEKTLRESEARFRSLFEHSPDAIFLAIPGGAVTHANPAACTMFGRTEEDLCRVGRQGIEDPADPRHAAAVAERARTGKVRYEATHVRHNGAKFPSEVSSVLLDGGRRSIVILRDITERKRAEEYLERTRNILAESQRIAHLGSFEYVADTQTTVWSEEEFRIYGLDPAEPSPPYEVMLAKHIHPDDAARLNETFTQALQSGSVYELEHRIIRPDGSVRLVYDRAQPFFDERGKLLRYVGATLDITERRRDEERLAVTLGQIQGLIDNTPAIVYAFDLEERFILANATVAELLNSTPEQMIGKRRHEFMPQVDADWHEANDRKVLEEDRALEFEEASQLRGRSITWLTTKFPLRDGQGRTYAVAGISTDVSDRKRAEEALQASLHEKEVLLKEVHHRVKNNLQVLSSLVSLQADTLTDPALRGSFADLRDRVRTMALVHEKLYQSESLARVNFAEYARSLLDYLWRAHGDTAATVRLTLELQPVEFSVEMAMPCGLILNELATNALKYAFPDRADGELKVTLKTDPDGTIHLNVSDNGGGFPPGIDWRQTRSLGLQLVQMLTEQLGGTLDVQHNGGTEFQITFKPERQNKHA